MLKLWRRFRYLIRQRRSETELAEEMAFHRAMAQQLLAVAACAGLIPARRAARVDPATALRSD